MLKKIEEAARYIKQKCNINPKAGIILGTGLGGLADELEVHASISYSDIPYFPVSTVKGHQGKMIAGTLEEVTVVALQGRFHYYEGYSLAEVTFPIRVLKYLGIDLLIVSNASGGLNPEFQVGDMMLIEDHINLMNDNPLIGPNHEGLGERFPDMSRPYDPELLSKARKVCNEHNISFRSGVYAGVTGPTFETPAEYKYIRTIGADAVGMSTVPEVIVANHMKLPVLAISVISDLGVEGKIVEISHEEVIDAASAVAPKLTKMIKLFLNEIK
jgi:purine-nucleoside phosphorylase